MSFIAFRSAQEMLSRKTLNDRKADPMASVPEADFSDELDKFRVGIAYDVTVIVERLNEMRIEYEASIGTRKENETRIELSMAMTVAFPAIVRYVTDNERNKAHIISAYSDANSRKSQAVKEADFWQGAVLTISMVVVIMLACVAGFALHPYAGSVWRWMYGGS